MTPDVLLSRSRALLLDFDGPICSVFAGIPSRVVADQLRAVLADSGRTSLPAEVAVTEDPFDVFRYAATLGETEALHVEAAFTAHEVEAIRTAEPTPGAIELMTAWHESSRPLAVVSNNSTAAIEAYIYLHNLRPLIDHVAARTSHHAVLLKPSPHLLFQAIDALDAEANHSVFIGDSVTDIQASRASGVPVIGYANKPGKDRQLFTAGTQLIASSMMIEVTHT